MNNRDFTVFKLKNAEMISKFLEGMLTVKHTDNFITRILFSERRALISAGRFDLAKRKRVPDYSGTPVSKVLIL